MSDKAKCKREEDPLLLDITCSSSIRYVRYLGPQWYSWS